MSLMVYIYMARVLFFCNIEFFSEVLLVWFL